MTTNENKIKSAESTRPTKQSEKWKNLNILDEPKELNVPKESHVQDEPNYSKEGSILNDSEDSRQQDSFEVMEPPTVEISISPDGLIRVFGLSQEVLTLLCETGLADSTLQKRMEQVCQVTRPLKKF